MAAPLKSAPPATPPKPSRMTLAAVTRGKLQQPTRTVLYGVEGIGKSTFGAGAPTPIFLGSEDGTAQLDVARLPMPETFAEALEAVRLLTREAHEYGTLVVDTLDWLEPLLWAHICKRDEQPNVESYGFGRGYVVALDEWRSFLAALETLRAAKRMHVILIAHSWIKLFKNPQGEDFDRHEMKLHNKTAGLIKEWADAVLFANYETFAKTDTKKRVRGVDTGARLLFTERRAAYDAKNRYSLPAELPLSWSDYFAAVQAGQAVSAADLKAEIARKAKALGPEMEQLVAVTVANADENVKQLTIINNRVNAKLAEKESQS